MELERNITILQGNFSHQVFFICSSLSGLVALDFMDSVDYGVDYPAPLHNDASHGVRVPEINLNLTQQVLTRLQQEVDPLAVSSNHAIELYEEVLV